MFNPILYFIWRAQPLVRLSYEIPTETFEVNVIGTANVLEAVRSLNKKCDVVLITTDKVYHNNEWIYPYRENDRLGGMILTAPVKPVQSWLLIHIVILF
ncbi:GDP-mannose 4,6-dehydratase [Flavobacterium sp. P21]|uniref:GDP-mannose 4,6-dehydratase n=1 Tax=Flavobacterium sp. P21 TaxID=3423948 RepID=UPI003D67DA09